MVVSHGIVGLATTTKTHLECLPVRGIIRLQTGLFRKLLQDQFLALIGAHDGHDREQRAARYRAREEKRGEERIFGFLHLCLLFPPNALSKPPPPPRPIIPTPLRPSRFPQASIGLHSFPLLPSARAPLPRSSAMAVVVLLPFRVLRPCDKLKSSKASASPLSMNRTSSRC